MGIIWTIVLGFVIGVIAKFITPGKENMGFLMTIGVGIAGSLLAEWWVSFWGGTRLEKARVHRFGHHGNRAAGQFMEDPRRAVQLIRSIRSDTFPSSCIGSERDWCGIDWHAPSWSRRPREWTRRPPRPSNPAHHLFHRLTRFLPAAG